jgi:hypothetical protein
MKLLMITFMIVVSICLLVISNNNLNLSEEGSFKIFTSNLFEWTEKISSNLVSITGHAVGLDWNPE